MTKDAAWQSTPRTFISSEGGRTLYVLRPVFDPPRPGHPYRPVTLREVYDLRHNGER